MWKDAWLALAPNEGVVAMDVVVGAPIILGQSVKTNVFNPRIHAG